MRTSFVGKYSASGSTRTPTAPSSRRLSLRRLAGAPYGFIANVWFHDIDTPLKRFVATLTAARSTRP